MRNSIILLIYVFLVFANRTREAQGVETNKTTINGWRFSSSSGFEKNNHAKFDMFYAFLSILYAFIVAFVLFILSKSPIALMKGLYFISFLFAIPFLSSFNSSIFLIFMLCILVFLFSICFVVVIVQLILLLLSVFIL